MALTPEQINSIRSRVSGGGSPSPSTVPSSTGGFSPTNTRSLVDKYFNDVKIKQNINPLSGTVFDKNAYANPFTNQGGMSSRFIPEPIKPTQSISQPVASTEPWFSTKVKEKLPLAYNFINKLYEFGHTKAEDFITKYPTQEQQDKVIGDKITSITNEKIIQPTSELYNKEGLDGVVLEAGKKIAMGLYTIPKYFMRASLSIALSTPLGEKLGGEIDTKNDRLNLFGKEFNIDKALGEEKITAAVKKGKDIEKKVASLGGSKIEQLIYPAAIVGGGLYADLTIGSLGKNTIKELTSITERNASEKFLVKLGVEASEENIAKVIGAKTDKQSIEVIKSFGNDVVNKNYIKNIDNLSDTENKIVEKSVEKKPNPNCLSKANVNAKELGIPVEKGVMVPEAKNQAEAEKIALERYKLRHKLNIESGELGANTHAWNTTPAGDVYDTSLGKGLVEDKYKYVSENRLLNLLQKSEEFKIEKPKVEIPKVEVPAVAKTPEEIKTKLTEIFTPEEAPKTTLKEKATNLFDKIRTNITNKYTPIKNETVKKEFENMTSYRAKAGSFVSDFEEQVIKPNLKDNEQFNHYLFDKRAESRIASKEARQAVGEWTKEDAQTALDLVKKEVGEKKFKQFEETAKVAQQHMDDSLKELVNSGVMSQEAYDAIKVKNDFYATFKVMKYVDDMDQFPKGTGISLNVSRQDVVKTMKGITEKDLKLGDIPTAMAEKIYQSRVVASKNRAMQKLGDMIGKEGGEKFVKLRDADKVKERIGALIKLKQAFKETRKLLRTDKIVNKRLKELAKKIEKTTVKMEELFDEARTLASEGEAPSKIVKLLEKVDTRERRIYKLIGDLDTGKSAVKKNELNKLLQERKESITELKKLLQENRDIKLKELPKGYEQVSYFKDGIKEIIAVPADVAEAVKSSNATNTGIILDMLKLAKAPMRMGVTTLNLGFQIKNIIIDTLRNATISKFRIRNPIDAVKFSFNFVQAVASSFGGNFGFKSKLYKQAEKEGIFSGGVYNTLSQNWGEFDPAKISNYAKLEKYKKWNPIDIFGRAGSALEETNKLLGFKRGQELIRKGKMTPADMLYEVRNFSGSPDFSRGGKSTSDLNVLFMFFNARVQGLSSDLKRLSGYAGGKGEAAKSWVAIATLVGSPVAYNAVRNNEKYYEDYNKLTDWEKRQNIVIFKDSFMKDNTGKDILDDNGDKIRDKWDIPVRDTLGAVKNMIEMFIDYGYKKGDKSFMDAMSKFAVGTAEDFSPLNISGKNIQEKIESIAASTNPLIKSTYEFISGRDSFRHRNVVPDYIEGVDSKSLEPKLQSKLDTPNFYKKLGELTGQSPLKLEQLAGNFGAVAVSQFAGKTGEQGNAVTRIFKGKPYVQLNQEELKQIQSIGAEAASVKLAENIKAGQLWESIKDKPRDERTKILQGMIDAKEMNKSMYERYQTIKNRDLQNRGLLDAELSKLGVTNGARAKAIFLTIKDKPENERVSYLKELQTKKILTKDVYVQYLQLKNNTK